MQKVLFLTTAHHFDDDRIFFHQVKTLAEEGFEVKISSLSSDFQGNVDGVQIESYPILENTVQEKIETFKKICTSFQPDCIICSEPVAVFAAKQYRKKKKTSIIYDITEWYPSMSMLENYSYPAKIFHAVKFFLVQLYAGFLSTYFIFGEETKKFPLAYFFPFKKSMILPYYPDKKYVVSNPKKLTSDKITLCYTGALSEDKGIGNFFKAVDVLSKKMPETIIKLFIVGAARKESDENYFKNLLSEYNFEHIEIRKPTSFEHFTEAFVDADICFDLRELNFENNHSLPIKLFYYIGAGKPVIYSDLKGIREHMDVSEFGKLVDPRNAEIISDLIVNYIRNPEYYYSHAIQARKAFEQQYNWGVIRNSFVDFVKKSIK
ncbi:glycosyltransferase [Chryseobacterium geocarposphaerae]|uniref:Glycosyltransferase involved in cell wall biosynthesis n=1 Tax=Chryseobacterium geocarposphaerae TaxID=1416776 RepID=A0A2M9C2U7_9FLAO|nr:glycosyltransferase [Chryseobacterium geocarposphaerae]PJJ64765.1 glycosyltransferase involved in cell wall biosynthesis [Chryseobacterium geocarposphaerae]